MTDLRADSMTGEQWVLEERSADPPSTVEGERWLRTDLNSGDKIATLRVDVGSSIRDVPIFKTGTAVDTVSEAMRVQVNGTTGYVPIAPVSETAFPELRMQHNSEIYAFHDRVGPGSAIPDSGVSRWEFEQTLEDSWGENDGTLVGGPQYVTDSRLGNYSLDFDGVDDGVDLPITATNGAAKSIACWVKKDDQSGNQRIFADSTRFDLTYETRDVSGGEGYQFRTFNGSSQGLVDSNITTVGEWVHLVGTYDGSTIELYVNGSSVGTDSAGSVSHENNWAFAYRRNGARSYYGGLIDDARFYDKELSSSEVQNLYNTGSISG